MIELKMRETQRLGLPKVRLEMIEYESCALMSECIRVALERMEAEADANQVRR